MAEASDDPMARSPDDPISILSRSSIIYDSFVKRIRVRLRQNSYDVVIGSGLLHRAGREIKRVLPSPGSRVFVVTSPTVRRHWGAAIEKSLAQAKLEFTILEMNDGEPAKRLETVERLAEQMVSSGADRKSFLVALGGGVVGDCAGFLAAMFLRGIPVVQIPTTFLAQVDASIGGKTGVNLRAGKNLIGAFHQPRAVLVDPDVLSTLDDREFRAGLFESLKCGIIRDKALFDFMRRQSAKVLGRDRKSLLRVIVDSIRIKADVVTADEKESDLRRILNFGHTIGHALESTTGYTYFLHGEAVAWGMIAAAAIACDSGSCSPETSEEIASAVKAYGPLPVVRCGAAEIMTRLSADKKTVAGAVHFVLPLKIGKVKIAGDVPPEVIRQAVEQIRNHA
jgi:3-dehydroquinate synthase